MARYLISFDVGAMDFPDEDLPQVSEAAHAVIQEAKAAGVFVFAGGLPDDGAFSVVEVDGKRHDGRPKSKALVGGLTILDLPSRESALEWAAKIAAACRCAQDVRAFLHDPEL